MGWADMPFPRAPLCLAPIALLTLAFVLLSPAPVSAQRPGGVGQQQNVGGASPSPRLPIYSSACETPPRPPPTNALVRISSNFSQIRMSAPTRMVVLPHSPDSGGDYDVVAEAPGYAITTERASISWAPPATPFTSTCARKAKRRPPIRVPPNCDVSPPAGGNRQGLEKVRKQEFDQARQTF